MMDSVEGTGVVSVSAHGRTAPGSGWRLPQFAVLCQIEQEQEQEQEYQVTAHGVFHRAGPRKLSSDCFNHF